MNNVYVNRTIRALVVIGITIGSLVGIYYVSTVTYPFIIAIGIALMINPVVNFLERKWRFPRSIAVLAALAIIISIFAGLITLLIAEIISGADYLSKEVPKHVDTVITYVENFIAGQIIPLYNHVAGFVKSLDPGQQDTILNNIKSAGSQLSATAGAFVKNFFVKLPSLVSWIPNAATVLVFSLLATFFISKDWDRLSKLPGRLLPDKARISSEKVFIDLKKALVGFLRAQLTLVSITAVIVLIGLLILRVDYAITIALVSMIADILPYLGTGIVFVPWIIYEFVAGNVGLAVGLGILYAVVVVQRQVMEPKILSSSIGLNPLATLVALFVGFKLFGFLGLIAGPVSLVIITALNRARVFHDIWKFIKGEKTIDIPK